MGEDFNTAGALQLIFRAVHSHAPRVRKKPPCPHTWTDLTDICCCVLGIVPPSIAGYRRRSKACLTQVRDAVEKLIAARLQARKAKHWDQADHIYRTLEGLDVAIQDGKGRTSYKMGRFTGSVREYHWLFSRRLMKAES